MTGAPTITFQNPAAGGTLSSNSESWTAPNTYTAIYDIADLNVSIQDIDIAISNATDNYGNTQVSNIQSDVFDIETDNPLATAITVSDTLITDADTAGTFTITVTYDRNMSAVSPTISFPVENPHITLQMLMKIFKI